MPKKTPPPSRQKIEQARLLYDAGAPIAEILALLTLSVGQFRRFREANGWPMRASACARKADPPQPPQPPPPAAITGVSSRGSKTRSNGIRPRRNGARQTCAENHRGERPRAREPREGARRVETLRRDADGLQRGRTRTMTKRERQRDEPPRELAELRAELARRLERLRGERATE